MEESIKGEAHLSDVEPEVFGQLLQFAYKGMCGVSDGITGTFVRLNPPSQFHCHRCGFSFPKGCKPTEYPFCSPSCNTSYKQAVESSRAGFTKSMVFCVVFNCPTKMRLNPGSTPGWLCAECSQNSNLDHYPRDEAQFVRTPGTCSGVEFRARLYGCKSLAYEDLSDHIERHRSSETDACSLIQHAKLYVVAKKYMIEDLQDIALHKLHRTLAASELDGSMIDEVVDLMLYTYANTSDEGDILDGTADRLRELVMAYVVDRAKILMRFGGFRTVLAAGGAQTADFMALAFSQEQGLCC